MRINPPFFLPMEPLIFTFYFTVEGCDVFVTIELFPHINVTMVETHKRLQSQHQPHFTNSKAAHIHLIHPLQIYTH